MEKCWQATEIETEMQCVRVRLCNNHAGSSVLYVGSASCAKVAGDMTSGPEEQCQSHSAYF